MYPTFIRTNIRQITATPQPNPAHGHSPHGQGGKATAHIASLIATGPQRTWPQPTWPHSRTHKQSRQLQHVRPQRHARTSHALALHSPSATRSAARKLPIPNPRRWRRWQVDSSSQAASHEPTTTADVRSSRPHLLGSSSHDSAACRREAALIPRAGLDDG